MKNSNLCSIKIFFTFKLFYRRMRAVSAQFFVLLEAPDVHATTNPRICVLFHDDDDDESCIINVRPRTRCCFLYSRLTWHFDMKICPAKVTQKKNPHK